MTAAVTSSSYQQGLMPLLIKREALTFTESNVVDGKLTGGVQIRGHIRPYLPSFQTLTQAKDLELIGGCFAEMIKGLGKPVQVIFTTSANKGPYATATIVALQKLGFKSNPSWATYTTCSDGSMKLVGVSDLLGKEAVVVEDTMDDGGNAVYDTVKFLKKSGAHLNGVVMLYDCLDQIKYGNPITAAQRIRIEGVVVKSHVTALHLLEKAKTWKSIGNQKTAKALQRYYEIWMAPNLAKIGELAGNVDSDTPPNKEQEELLSALILKGALKIDDQTEVKDGRIVSGGYKLAEGRKCPYEYKEGFFNDGESLAMISQMFADVLGRLKLQFDVICAPELQRSAYAVATMLRLYEKKQNSTYACCRILYGHDNNIVHEQLEGDVKEKKVVIIEQESMMEGTNIHEVIGLIKRSGGTTVLVLTPYNRQEKTCDKELPISAPQRISGEHNVRVISLVNTGHLKQHLAKSGNTKAAVAIDAYQARWKEPNLLDPALSGL